MDLLLAGSILGITLGLVMILAFIVPAVLERRRDEDSLTDLSMIEEREHLDDEALRARSMTREEIWKRGCRGESLEKAEQQEFEYLARARFHTFQMGLNHATRDATRSSLLIRGFAVELAGAPGLERLWQASDMSDDAAGKAVNAELLELQRKPGPSPH